MNVETKLRWRLGEENLSKYIVMRPCDVQIMMLHVRKHNEQSHNIIYAHRANSICTECFAVIVSRGISTPEMQQKMWS